VLPFPPATASVRECRRALSSVALLTAYATASWVKAENHFCVAQGWLTVCCGILRFAAVRQLHSREWKTTYTLARDAARAALAALTKEAAEAPDLVIPDVAEGMVYPYRALLVCGCLGAYFLSERTLTEDVDRTTVERIRAVLTRELQYGRIAGECDVPGFLMWSAALEQLGEIQSGEAMGLTLVQGLAARNQPNSKTAFPDPYHPTEDVLLHQSGVETPLDNERFDGRAYTLHASIEWVARRLWRNFLKGIWADITHITFHELRPSDPTRYLAAEDPDGVFTTSFPGQPESWGALLARSRALDRAELPDILWKHREMLPYVPLLFPYRFTPTLAKVIDLIASDPRA
jgi:hypothetical protein